MNVYVINKLLSQEELMLAPRKKESFLPSSLMFRFRTIERKRRVCSNAGERKELRFALDEIIKEYKSLEKPIDTTRSKFFS